MMRLQGVIRPSLFELVSASFIERAGMNDV